MDTISNFIIKLKNAGNAGQESVTVPFSKLKLAICEVLKKEGFIKSFEEKTEKGRAVVVIELYSENRIPKIKGVQRISKPSKRVYRKAEELRAVKSGYGALILSTSAGVMTGREAKKAKLGGEALFSIW
jgi:small subunit ribosomal protein S8